MPKIINLHIDNWQLTVETADEDQSNDVQDALDRLDLAQIEDLEHIDLISRSTSTTKQSSTYGDISYG